MSEESTKKRPHDVPTPAAFGELMKSGWVSTTLDDLQPTPPLSFCQVRRAELSKAFPGVRLVIPSGNYKVRSNDSDYAYRPHTAFAYYTGVQGVEATADAVLVMQPNGNGHDAYLYIHPRSTRDTDAFFRDAKYGELWVGRRFTLAEAKDRYQIPTRAVTDLKELLLDGSESIAIRAQDIEVDTHIAKHDRDEELLTFVSEARLIKDEYEINELQAACDASELGFQEIVKAIPTAVAHHRGERVLEAAFFTKARTEGNDVGYTTIAAGGAHACVLHWIRNDGKINNGELVLVDAGVEMDSFYTADITRTLPVNGKFSPAQRSLYMLVYEAQLAGFAAVKPGATFRSINIACQEVLAKGLFDMGVLPCSVEDSMKPEMGLHRRWTLHGVSHMLGMDVHDCQHARQESYLDGILAEGMVLTVEPGLYIQPDDELFPAEFRGIGIRIEDDVVVTKDGCRNLSQALPRHPDEVEAWMAKFS
jgi:Xaa-Pro aminopeptidase